MLILIHSQNSDQGGEIQFKEKEGMTQECTRLNAYNKKARADLPITMTQAHNQGTA